jgi:hypothetical protein
MSLTQMRLVVVTTWLASLVVAIGAALAFGLVTSPWSGAVLFLVGCVPAVMVPLVFRGAPPQTIAEGLYSERAAATPNSRLYADLRPPQGR